MHSGLLKAEQKWNLAFKFVYKYNSESRVWICAYTNSLQNSWLMFGLTLEVKHQTNLFKGQLLVMHSSNLMDRSS